MKLERVVLENFGPYFGRQQMDLAVTDAAPVVVVYGENMHGKTSLFNALRWCLYGQVGDRTGRPIKRTELVNYDSADAGKYSTRVVLLFEHEGRSYELERQIQARARPVDDHDFSEIKTLRIDGSFEAEQKIDEHIADVLHRDIADFFFFDGEMLNRYEDLLSDDASAAPLIKRSIEQILGLPALQSMATDLEDLERGATRKHAQALKAAKSHAALATQAQDLGKSLVAVEEDLEALNRLLLKEEAEKEGLRQKRQRFAQVEAEAKALGAVEDEIRELEAERRLQKEACRAILSDSWWLPVAPMANAHFEIATAELTEATGHLAKAERLRDEIRRTQEALQRGECPSCGGSVSGEARRRLERQESEAAADLAALPAVSPGDLGEKGQALTQLKVFGDLRPMQAFVDAERHYRRQGLEIRRRERRADSIREALRGHDEAEIRDLEHHYDAVVGRIADVAKSIEAQT